MSRDQILALLRQALPELRAKYGLKELALFGSVARDEAVPGSDVDLLATYEGQVGLRAYMGLKLELEERLGARVDLVTPAGLKPRIKPFVDRDLIRVA